MIRARKEHWLNSMFSIQLKKNKCINTLKMKLQSIGDVSSKCQQRVGYIEQEYFPLAHRFVTSDPKEIQL